mmetsp:Transcript_12618/g.19562  ORF Transcript_12618/g.19562 Transcript_12618/m.19562 type:complete len:434 (+) Transcript_12618:173-1474(+)|eukprot:CAMPEP_0195295616 /NCGR_PEP_ID=MMETSP0707-20130614/17719_1 /TAXON_ID=33640 /ORGANISM="Asterionellopsis glacialis, Strain CCMP134" /LENGTH=433 /DNA_ID=CAMNT_0040356881 /DNA_START=154 /DNA_END=1455 /DNA_ORIENTATION=+
MRFTTKILPSRSANLGILQLNHPKALHALTLDMVHMMEDMLMEWHKDETLQAVLLRSSSLEPPPEGKKRRYAFCAGGDVKSVYQAGVSVENDSTPKQHGKGQLGLLTSDFFHDEYKVNHALATYTKPCISLWDGVVMGGGVGISIWSQFRIATEHTMWSMPETAIGLFPDVGSTYWMSRLLSPSTGLAPYLALSGKRLNASDLIHAGIATHYVPSSKLQDLEQAIVEATKFKTEQETGERTTETVQDLSSVITSFHETPSTGLPQDSFLSRHASVIKQVFGDCLDKSDNPNGTAVGMEDIMARLDEASKKNDDTPSNDDFASTTLESITKMSPTSLKLTLEGLKRGLHNCSTVGECLQMEYRMGQSCMKNPPHNDFYRGIRSVLIDRDHNPQWSPSTVQDVTQDHINTYFQAFDDPNHEWKIPSALGGNPSKL